jgi:hypothetical protein
MDPHRPAGQPDRKKYQPQINANERKFTSLISVHLWLIFLPLFSRPRASTIPEAVIPPQR